MTRDCEGKAHTKEVSYKNFKSHAKMDIHWILDMESDDYCNIFKTEPKQRF
jgi:hypothetical protein